LADAARRASAISLLAAPAGNIVAADQSRLHFQCLPIFWKDELVFYPSRRRQFDAPISRAACIFSHHPEALFTIIKCESIDLRRLF
jgi:hypothetical protein